MANGDIIRSYSLLILSMIYCNLNQLPQWATAGSAEGSILRLKGAMDGKGAQYISPPWNWMTMTASFCWPEFTRSNDLKWVKFRLGEVEVDVEIGKLEGVRY